jgi:hypothetical protein
MIWSAANRRQKGAAVTLENSAILVAMAKVPVRYFVLASIALLFACSSKTEDLKQRYEIVRTSGTLGEACTTAKELRDAYLEENDKDEYQRWGVSAAIQCQAADLDGANLPADQVTRDKLKSDVDNATDSAIWATANAVN